MTWVNLVLNYWIETSWFKAWLMSAIVNILIYVCSAFFLERIINFLVKNSSSFNYINSSELREKQHLKEVSYGIIACIIFAFGSLIARVLFNEIYPASLLTFLFQLISFVIFYEIYSYLVHRLLHTKLFAKIHRVHHSSIRVTPWSSYCVHPIEAVFIGLSIGIFMLFFKLSLIIALLFHVFGMIFTIFIHSNVKVTLSNKLLNTIISYPRDHAKHHMNSKVNFGFISKHLDKIFSTLESKY